MTLPVLISKYNEKTWLTAFKRTYSVIYQAYLGAYQDNGVASTWCTDKNTECGKTYFDILSPYLKVAHVWGFQNLPDLAKVSYRDLDGDSMASSIFTTSYYKFVLNDGTLIGISHSGGGLNSPLLQIDTNGLRGPNQLGKDVFYISLISKQNYPVIGGYSLWWLSSKIYCSRDSVSGWWSGGGCSLWIIATGNMDYLQRNLTLEEWKNAVKSLLLDLNKDSLD